MALGRGGWSVRGFGMGRRWRGGGIQWQDTKPQRMGARACTHHRTIKEAHSKRREGGVSEHSGVAINDGGKAVPKGRNRRGVARGRERHGVAFKKLLWRKGKEGWNRLKRKKERGERRGGDLRVGWGEGSGSVGRTPWAARPAPYKRSAAAAATAAMATTAPRASAPLSRGARVE